jgi:hypothetical protein
MNEYMNEPLKASPELDCQSCPSVDGVNWSEEGLIRIPSTFVSTWSSILAWMEDNKSAHQ